MNEQLKERLNKILPRLESREFLENSGLGSEIGFYIFDYPPEDELAVREHVRVILDHLAKKRPDLQGPTHQPLRTHRQLPQGARSPGSCH